MNTMGTRLKLAIKEKGWKPADLVSRKVLSRAGYYQWINDEVKPDKVRAETVAKLCKTLGVERDWLLYGKLPMRVTKDAADGEPSAADRIRTLEQDIHAIRLALSAMAAVMVSHRPAEASDLVGALSKLPPEYSQQGLAKLLGEALAGAIDRQGKARSSAGNL